MIGAQQGINTSQRHDKGIGLSTSPLATGMEYEDWPLSSNFNQMICRVPINEIYKTEKIIIEPKLRGTSESKKGIVAER